jgi:membrane fusion protein, multidrug efflux system
VTAPIAAIQHGPNGLFVYTVKPDNTVQQQDVRIAYQDNETVAVSQGAQGGDIVVLTGQSHLSTGTRVAVNSATPAAGGKS